MIATTVAAASVATAKAVSVATVKAAVSVAVLIAKAAASVVIVARVVPVTMKAPLQHRLRSKNNG